MYECVCVHKCVEGMCMCVGENNLRGSVLEMQMESETRLSLCIPQNTAVLPEVSAGSDWCVGAAEREAPYCLFPHHGRPPLRRTAISGQSHDHHMTLNSVRNISYACANWCEYVYTQHIMYIM